MHIPKKDWVRFDLSKTTAKKLTDWWTTTGTFNVLLTYRYEHHATKNKSRLWFYPAYSNLQLARKLLQRSLEQANFGRSKGAIQRMIHTLTVKEEEVPLCTDPIHCNNQGLRVFTTPRELRFVEECWTWVTNHYQGNYHWLDIPHTVRFRSHRRAYCRYHHQPNGTGWKYLIDVDPAQTHNSGLWYTYGRNTLGYRANGIEPPTQDFLLQIQLIHEFTHAIEHHHAQVTNTEFSGGEHTTTLHELRWVKEHFPDTTFQELEKVQDGRRKEWYSPV